jgi:UDP-glucose-4-epimerase GalE
MRIAVTGGAGYIGSLLTWRLVEAGHDVLVLDNLDRGHRDAVHPGAAFVHTDVLDTQRLTEALTAHRVELVMHFAALAYVGESVVRPLDYYHVNAGGMASLLVAMKAAGIKRMVFSSSCATFGAPAMLPISEETPQEPINPYGWSKLFGERMMQDASVADPDFSWIVYRYFNVAGAPDVPSLGERHDPETHIIPLALFAAAGWTPPLRVGGDDWPTPDGTCIRDYLHVEDVVAAHLIAVATLSTGTRRFYNLGVGSGWSIRQVLDSVQRVTGRPVPHSFGPRRAGDPPELWARATLAERELGWRPRFTDLDTIIETAWRWHQLERAGRD